ncbi:hypothetical protein U14_00299 [Candidatus Moduliflexus flocculans]|uniref:Lipoprotein n=1 Tax=Candidatus Moduliflexus flocculans TaxID=1499966 RepID=A0A0S6VU61_9BACT|nr:hypothetical protein U14_00299 [Candidatus Moduliflexus flocculans]
MQIFKYVVFTTIALISLTSCVKVNSYQEETAPAAANSHEPHTYLQSCFQFTDEELAAMERGEVIVKIFEMPTIENEVGAFGVVQLNVPKEAFVEQFRDIVSFTKSPEVKAIAKFSTPPRLEDMQDLTLSDQVVAMLKTCKPGNCKVKMDARMMERFHQEIDWKAADYHEQATLLMKQMLLDYVTRYLREGDQALGQYDDQAEPLRIADAFHGVLGNSTYLKEYVPELLTYLEDFPKGHLPHVENFFYWSIEQFGLRPVINLYHVTIYTRQRNGTNDVFITSKQIYASHYFEIAFAFTAFVDEAGGASPTKSYLMYLNRSRFDNLYGGLKGAIVTVAKGKVYNGVKFYFQQVKNKLETSVLTHKAMDSKSSGHSNASENVF